MSFLQASSTGSGRICSRAVMPTFGIPGIDAAGGCPPRLRCGVRSVAAGADPGRSRHPPRRYGQGWSFGRTTPAPFPSGSSPPAPTPATSQWKASPTAGVSASS